MKRCTYQFEGYTPTGDGRCVGIEGHWPDKPHCPDSLLAEEWGLQLFTGGGRHHGPRYDSRRYFHERTGAPLSAYVVGGYVVEKARRDWDARPYRGSAGNPTEREWWEVRRQGSLTQPGVSIGKLLYQGATLRDCVRWIGEQA